jgi:MFS family permease
MESTVTVGRRPASRGRHGLIGLLTANAVSLTGTQITMIAVPWYVMVTTGSAAATGLVSFCALVPYLATRLAAGPVIDRRGARRVSIAADSASVVATGAIPLLHAAGLLPLWLLAVVAAVAGAARGPGDSAKSALVPRVAQDSGAALERVTGLNGTVTRLAGSIGPAVAGALVAAGGPLSAVTLDAASFGISAAIVAWSMGRDAVADEPEAAAGSVGGASDADGGSATDAGGAPESFRRQLAAGFRFLRGDRALLGLTMMVTATNLLDNGVMSVVLPVWARHHGGPIAIGLVTSVVGATAMVGSICASVLAGRLNRRLVYFVCFAIGGGPRIAFLALGVPVWATVAVWGASGLALGFVSPILSAVMYERIPAPLIGRVSALTGTLSVAGTPLGGPVAGLAVGVAGYAVAAVIFGGCYLAATILPVFGPSWSSDEDAEVAPPAESVEPAVPGGQAAVSTVG